MSAFTRLYYANRGPGGFDRDESYDHPFEDAFHGPSVPIVPEHPHDEPPSLGDVLRSRAKLPRIDLQHAARNPS